MLSCTTVITAESAAYGGGASIYGRRPRSRADGVVRATKPSSASLFHVPRRCGDLIHERIDAMTDERQREYAGED
jgi:hypothetical protein